MIDLKLQSDREKLEQLISDDINKFCETFYEQERRNHLGASEMGEECWRKLYYGFRWTKLEHFDGRMMRLFNVGHSAEPRFVNYLKGIGFEVREFDDTILNYHPESDNYFWSKTFVPSEDGMLEDVTGTAHEIVASTRKIHPKQFRISGAMGHYGGSLDGMCKAPAKYELWEDIIILNEFKTNGTGAAFDKVDKEGVQKSKPRHFSQMSQYAWHYKLRYGLYLIENKNDSSIIIKIVELDWNLGQQLEKKAEAIILAKEPPPRISENPAFFNCKFCHQKDICHNGEIPEKNCRSCRNSMPTENATWTCSMHGLIPSDFIKLGCQDWLPI